MSNSDPIPVDALESMSHLPVRGAAEAARLVEVAAERYRRKLDALKLFRPMETQLPFFLSEASERIVRGGNRSGKSMSSFAEFASAVTGMPIIGPDGTPLPFKYPKDRPLLTWVIGMDEQHIGGTIFRMLFQPKAFKIIRDEETGAWRAWNPNDPADFARRSETKFADPLIPSRMIDPKGWSWKDRGLRVFNVCRLRNGTEIHAFSSGGNVKMGDPVDLILIDEDIEKPEYVAEWQARLSDLKGRLIWSAWPHSKNEALVRMSERAEEQKHLSKPDIFEIVLRFSDNPFIDDEEKRKRREGWSDEEIRTRDSGEFLTDTVLMYPSFSRHVHSIPRKDCPAEIDKLVENMGGQIPVDWANYLALDPGHTHPAVLFAAVPPPSEFGDHLVIWQEFYGRSIDADKLAAEVAERASGRFFEAFIIDGRAGRQTPMGFNHTIQTQYANAFARYGLVSYQTASNFIRGSDDVSTRANEVRRMLAVRGDGSTKLLIIGENTPQLRRQFSVYKKKIVHNEIKDEPVGRNNDLMNCLEYLAAFNPQYVGPRTPNASYNPAWAEFLRWSKKEEPGKTMHMGAGARPSSPAGAAA